jgi:hypothetical protein
VVLLNLSSIVTFTPLYDHHPSSARREDRRAFLGEDEAA